MKIKEIAERISAHLKRFEADPIVNKTDSKYGTRPYYYAHAWDARSRVGVKYVSYQGEAFLPKADAEKYLAWLDAGNVGRHFELRGWKRP